MRQDVGGVSCDTGHLPHRALREQALSGHLAPYVFEAGGAGDIGTRGQKGAIERPDARPEDKVGAHAGLGKRTRHTDLGGAEHAATAEDEGDVGAHRTHPRLRGRAAVARMPCQP
ncbi:hypothetical protein GCM10009810_03740 [Nostocoides vanveenii]|uniref:Uncharacterized protein n=1 Tax=Nostocoides vanveenii TaxID=330835 RepID=A0ABN2K2B7_9MICO